MRVIKEDTRSLDYGSYSVLRFRYIGLYRVVQGYIEVYLGAGKKVLEQLYRLWG